MPVQLTQLAQKLSLTPKELENKIKELGFKLKRKKEIEDDLAELLEKELAKPSKEEQTEAEVYEEIIHKQLDREIIKAQRKKTAGKKPVEKEIKKQEAKKEIVSKKAAVQIADVISVKEFAEKSGISAAKIIGELMKNGILANINQKLDFDTALIVADDLGIKITRKREAAKAEDLLERNLEKLLKEDDPKDLVKRPPIVSVMGHVDHGKTKLLDTIRETNVVESESGGITQHIGAYQIEKNKEKITFLDTPGHEAFTAMRARGAKATDIAILVVAADEGVKPQTIEAINHAKEAKIPIIVAINKIDKPEANSEKVKTELTKHGLQPEEWGGNTIMVEVSAMTGEGIDRLLEIILLVAEISELKANPHRPAVGTVIEAHLDPSLGPIATILINTGTLKVMDNVVIGSISGRIKTMRDYKGDNLRKSLPSDAVQISGLSGSPQTGDILQVVPDERTARTQAMKIKVLTDSSVLAKTGGVEEIISKINAGKLKTLKVVLKVDTKGSLEAVKQAILNIKSENVAIKIIHSGIGNISESDVLMASASEGIVVGFNVQARAQVKTLAERENIEIVLYDVIYNLIEDIKNILSGLLEPEIVTVELGKAKVKQIFMTGKKEMIVGCKAIEGKIEKKAKLRVVRDGEKIAEGKIESLKRVNEDIDEITKDNECGIKFVGECKLQEGDILEAYKAEKKMKTL